MKNYKIDFESVTQYFLNSFLLTRLNKVCARRQATLRESMIFSSLLKAQNLDSSRGFVKIQLVAFRCSHGEWRYLLWLCGLSKSDAGCLCALFESGLQGCLPT